MSANLYKGWGILASSKPVAANLPLSHLNVEHNHFTFSSPDSTSQSIHLDWAKYEVP